MICWALNGGEAMERDEDFSGFDLIGLVCGVVGILVIVAMVGYALWHLWAVVAG